MSYFRKNIESIAGYTPGFQPKEANVVKLNTNENPYPPSQAVLKAVREITDNQLRRYPDPAGEIFRRAAAKINGLRPGNIMCCNGGDDLLSICIRAFCDEQRPLAYPSPSYSLYPVLAGIQDCKVIEIPFGNEFSLPADLVETDAGLTIVCNPNAPTGSFIGVDKIAKLAEKLKGALLIDEAYVDFAEDNCARLVKKYDNVIILRSMSKGYSLAGIRFGYAIADENLIAGLMKVKDSYNVDVIALAAATAAVEDEQYHRQVVDKVKKQRKILIEQLRQLGFAVPDSSANFVLVKCKNCNAAQIYDKLTGQGIYVRYFKLPGLEDKLRITVGTTEQNEKLISALKQIL